MEVCEFRQYDNKEQHEDIGRVIHSVHGTFLKIQFGRIIVCGNVPFDGIDESIQHWECEEYESSHSVEKKQ